MDNFFDFLFGGSTRSELVLSALWIISVLFLRFVVVKLHFARHPEMSIEEKRRWAVTGRNLTVVLLLLGLIGVWGAQIQTFALSMVALAAATVVATKELIMCLSGSLLRFSTKQYVVGDYIKVGGLRGRVVDINLFNTLMMQIGPHELIGSLSGKTVSFPNSLLLSHTVERDNVLGPYVVHTLDIPVPVHLDSDAIVPELESVLNEACSPYIAEIEAYFEDVQMTKLFFTPAAYPRVSRVPHDDKVYHIVVRFASPLKKRLEIQQAVLDRFMRVQYQLLNS
ncbi:MAG: mechanosensitive ion channel [Neisseria sp.]|nr:mechanosensitive ion channel [Neisseria sp.]